MLLTKFCKKPESSAYDKLQNEEGYFDSVGATKQQATKQVATSTKKYTYNNIPQTAEALVARLNKDIESLPKMTDAFGIEIRKQAIEKLTAFLKANNIDF